MWLITKHGFISVVAHDTNPDLVRVRARDGSTWNSWFDMTANEVIEMPDADYRWHADVHRLKLMMVMADAISDLDYTSHVKESVAGDDRAMYRAMLDCWSALHRLQEPATGSRTGRTPSTDLDS